MPPQRVANVRLRDSVDTRRELQLRGGLHLRVNAAGRADDRRELALRRACRERLALEPARTHRGP